MKFSSVFNQSSVNLPVTIAPISGFPDAVIDYFDSEKGLILAHY